MNECSLPEGMPRNDFMFDDDRSYDVDLILDLIILASWDVLPAELQVLRSSLKCPDSVQSHIPIGC